MKKFKINTGYNIGKEEIIEIEIDREEAYFKSDWQHYKNYILARNIINEQEFPAENKKFILFVLDSIYTDFSIYDDARLTKEANKRNRNKRKGSR